MRWCYRATRLGAAVVGEQRMIAAQAPVRAAGFFRSAQVVASGLYAVQSCAYSRRAGGRARMSAVRPNPMPTERPARRGSGAHLLLWARCFGVVFCARRIQAAASRLVLLCRRQLVLCRSCNKYASTGSWIISSLQMSTPRKCAVCHRAALWCASPS